MATDQDMSGWTDLLHSSTKLLEQAAPSAQFPPLQVFNQTLLSLSLSTFSIWFPRKQKKFGKFLRCVDFFREDKSKEVNRKFDCFCYLVAL